ncbi:uncharacterized protein [Narcine bancroftii]|uniref:uncharacterized protein isoform X2 n=1 Tax=Narcine bancroftii TaxID=1343680 RepID=UPI003831DE48
MEEERRNRAGIWENQSWDWSSESEAYTSDLDSTVSDAGEEGLTEECDYLRPLLQIIGKPPPFQYYTEFENALNNPRTESSFSFLHAGDHERGSRSPNGLDVGWSLDRDVSSPVSSADEGESPSLESASQCKKVKYSGVISPFSMRTLAHPSFQSFYTAVASQQRRAAELDRGTFENHGSVASCSSADPGPRSQATALCSQEINMPALHQCDFFYTDPMLPSGYRVYNHLSLPTHQMIRGLQLNTPPPIMSVCVAPTSVQTTVLSPVLPLLNEGQGQSRPISDAEHDAISTLLELKQHTRSDSAKADASECPLKRKGSSDEDEINGLSANSGASGITDGTKEPLLFLNDCNPPALKSHHDTGLHKPHHLPECECFTPPHKSTDCSQASGPHNTSTGE